MLASDGVRTDEGKEATEWTGDEGALDEPLLSSNWLSVAGKVSASWMPALDSNACGVASGMCSVRTTLDAENWRSIDSWIFSNWMWSIVFEKHRKNQVKTYRLDQGATLSSSLLAMSSENVVGNNQNNFNIWIYHVCFIQWNWQLWWYDRYYILCTTKNQSAAWLASKSAMVCSISCKHRANTKDLLLKCHLTWNHSNIYHMFNLHFYSINK